MSVTGTLIRSSLLMFCKMKQLIVNRLSQSQKDGVLDTLYMNGASLALSGNLNGGNNN